MERNTDNREPIELGAASEQTLGGPGIVTDFVQLQNRPGGMSDD